MEDGARKRSLKANKNIAKKLWKMYEKIILRRKIKLLKMSLNKTVRKHSMKLNNQKNEKL